MSADVPQSPDQPTPAAFDALYRGDFNTFRRDAQPSGTTQYTEFEFDRVPWDIGEAQPVVRNLEADGQFTSEVLDIGSGPGENANFLAERGYHVCGLDAAPAAIDIARERARERGLDQSVDFDVADATDLTGYADRFTTVIDSALYHCFPEDQRHGYVAAVHRACRPHARMHVVCFSDQVPDEFPGPFRIGEDNLRGTLADAGWIVRRLERTTYTTAFTRADLMQQPTSSLTAIVSTLGFDSQDRLLAPAWLATAERS
ncbi:class I SAM-dependent methyltransferase [Rhodococcus sp. ABRD24]|uniref:SAM-dependent methyltransferase n=1 Tax=Rhodococcus sp. ABRD24 TaxID=2507582 RepID=UPI00103FCFA6|nr:class I SAM-dependent methyltransferase [Rhodococcus sp. ABRD24]QBJ96819.1 class I SAM-dependent methyltransferase [Rhodococcus sp. ABRD24]